MFSAAFTRFKRYFNMVRDVLVANLTYALSNSIKWLYQSVIKKQIASFPLELKSNLPPTKIPLLTRALYGATTSLYGKTPFLYLHSRPKREIEKEEVNAVLFLHGVHGHPHSMLHLADLAQKKTNGFIFSLYLPYNQAQPEVHRDYLKQALDKIELIANERQSKLKGIVAVGHSLGAIESSFQAFVNKDPRIISVISIAGRLRVVPSKEMPCKDYLKPTVDSVFQGLQELPELPLYQIVAGKDWNAPLEATAIRPEDHCCHIVKNARHLNVLYHKETKKKFCDFLLNSID